MTNDINFFDNKIIVLYILTHSSKPLSLEQIVKLCEDFDDITYFDICSYITSLKESKYISEILDGKTVTYTPTELGINTSKELNELIPGVSLFNLKKIVEKNLSSVKTASSVYTATIPISNDEYRVSCGIKDGNHELVKITLYATSKEQAKNISKNWDENSDSIYNTLISLLTKDDKDND